MADISPPLVKIKSFEGMDQFEHLTEQSHFLTETKRYERRHTIADLLGRIKTKSPDLRSPGSGKLS